MTTLHRSNDAFLTPSSPQVGPSRTGRSPRVSLLSWYRARFHECDPIGHVNNAVLIGMLEQAGMDLVAARGFSQAHTRTAFNAVFVVREYGVKFLQPAYENDVLMVHATGVDMRGVKAVVRYELRRIAGDPMALPAAMLIPADAPHPAPESDLIVSAESTYVFVSLSRLRPARIPEEVVDAFFFPEAGVDARSIAAD